MFYSLLLKYNKLLLNTNSLAIKFRLCAIYGLFLPILSKPEFSLSYSREQFSNALNQSLEFLFSNILSKEITALKYQSSDSIISILKSGMLKSSNLHNLFNQFLFSLSKIIAECNLPIFFDLLLSIISNFPFGTNEVAYQMMLNLLNKAIIEKQTLDTCDDSDYIIFQIMNQIMSQ